MVRIYLEAGNRRTFACAIDWPGWCRSAKGEDAALEALAAYVPRYAVIAADAGFPLPAGANKFAVVERIAGGVSTDFGAPERPARVDAEPLSADGARRLAALVAAGWRALDRAAARAPEQLAKGPRGGGRDRDAVLQHVFNSETSYARKLGVRHKDPRFDDAGAVAALHAAIIDVIGSRAPGVDLKWPLPYAARRIAWHVIDHAWEIEDRGGLEPERVGVGALRDGRHGSHKRRVEGVRR